MDAFHLTFPSGSFDVVCLSNTLHHLSNPEAVLREMTRMVKPQGVLMINEMVSDGLTPSQASHRKIHHFSADIDREFGIVHKKTYTRKGIEELLTRQSGWDISESWVVDFGISEPASPEEVEAIVKSLDRQILRLDNPDRISILSGKAKRIQNHLRRHGIDSCPQLLCILKQKKG